jgi:hypothetical protein
VTIWRMLYQIIALHGVKFMRRYVNDKLEAKPSVGFSDSWSSYEAVTFRVQDKSCNCITEQICVTAIICLLLHNMTTKEDVLLPQSVNDCAL